MNTTQKSCTKTIIAITAIAAILAGCGPGAGRKDAAADGTAQTVDTARMAAAVQTADTSGADAEGKSGGCADTSWADYTKSDGYKCRAGEAGRREYIRAEFLNLITKGTPQKGRDTWFRFGIDGGEQDYGFIDMRGKTRMVLARSENHSDYMYADRFDDIIIYDERYITKTGKRVGKDSVRWYLDGEGLVANCESEGFIVFKVREKRTRKSDDPQFCEYDHEKSGMFNRNGDVVIPADYEILGEVRNGMVYARKNCVMINALGEECIGKNCDPEHCTWGRGTAMLLDTMNNVLIENFGSTADVTHKQFANTLRNIGIDDLEESVDFYSVKKTNTPHPDKIRASFPAKGGGYYSFVVYEREFMRWLMNDLLKNLTAEKLIDAASDIIHCGTLEDEDRYSDNKRQFITANFAPIKETLLGILNPKLKKQIEREWYYTPLTYRLHLMPLEYINNCGRYNFDKHPVIRIYIEDKSGKDDPDRNRHRSFTFLRTKEGYKLRSVWFGN